MDRLFVFSASVAPGLMILAYGVAKSRSDWRNEALWTAFLVGAIGAFAAVAVELGADYVLQISSMPYLSGAAFEAVLIAAIPEETIKFVVLVSIAERHVDARRVQDILVLALGVSLGFATLENLFYIATPTEWQFTALARAITAVPGHGIDGIAMGALLTAARLCPGKYKVPLALGVPILLHAAYDFPLFALKGDHSQWWLLVIWVAVLILSAVIAIFLCNRILPLAREADCLSERDQRTPASSMPLIAGGCVMMVISPMLAVAALYLKDFEYFWAGAVLCILPAALGIDLIYTGIRQRKLRSTN
jgi:RsiW-degrading membrane proteinase PrsW (M82 family)